MLADLTALRELQEGQLRALEAGETDRVVDLCADGRNIADRLTPDAITDGEVTDEVRSLARQVLEAQAQLEEAAARSRADLLDQIRALGSGREALAAYRPASRGMSRLLDRAN